MKEHFRTGGIQKGDFILLIIFAYTPLNDQEIIKYNYLNF